MLFFGFPDTYYYYMPAQKDHNEKKNYPKLVVSFLSSSFPFPSLLFWRQILKASTISLWLITDHQRVN